ncbi:TPA: hypothetical protein ACH3X1_007537 [Trebouxia sp. C0004]
MKYYLAPVSRSGAVAFSSTIHAVLLKNFPAGSEMVQAGQFDQLVCDIMELLDQYARQLNLKRKRNEGEVSLTLNAKRPDLCVLVRSALLFKGEDKTEEGQLDQAVAELKQKMRRWSQSYHGQVEFLLCYAMAGGRVRICMLRRDDPDSCHVVSGDHSIYDMRGRLELVRIAILLYRILAIQQTQLPSDAVPLASVLEFSSGTKITVMEDYVIKRVDIEKQPLLVDRLAELQELYKATRASKHLIASEEGPHIHKKYTVILSPFGEQLGPSYLSFRIQSLAQLQAAIRCILFALRDLHAAKFAHTDIRWPNVIKCNNETFRLIDLETAVILGCKWSVRQHGPHRVGWRNNTLTQGRYTAGSDLALVGQLLTEPGLPPLGESGSHFAEELMAKSLSLEQALHHVWLHP